jgi:hypothetical protein
MLAGPSDFRVEGKHSAAPAPESILFLTTFGRQSVQMRNYGPFAPLQH